MSHPMPSPRSARFGACALFAVNGVFTSSVLPRIPEISDALDLTPGALGTALAGLPAGALLAGLFAGPLVSRRGGGQVSLGCLLVFGALLWLPAVAPGWWALAVAVGVYGALDAVNDVGMNSQALAVQRRYGRAIISSFHGWWSVGSVVGAASGVGAAAAGVPVAVQLVATGVVGVVLLLVVVRPRLMPDTDVAARADDGSPGLARSPWAVLRGLGLLVPFAVVIVVLEDVPAGWAALWLRDDLGAAPALAGVGFVCFASAMTVGRFCVDRIVVRHGPARVVRVGTTATALAITTAVLVGHPAVALIAFVVAGLGTAALFPAMLTAAGERPGLDPGHALAMVSWIARIGFLVSPPMVGAVADRLSLSWGVALMAVAAAAAAALAGTLRTAGVPPTSPR